MPSPLPSNTLFDGDNLAILRDYIADKNCEEFESQLLGQLTEQFA